MIHLVVVATEHLTGEFHVDLRIQESLAPESRSTTLYHWHGLVPEPKSGVDAPTSRALLAVFDACRVAYDNAPF